MCNIRPADKEEPVAHGTLSQTIISTHSTRGVRIRVVLYYTCRQVWVSTLPLMQELARCHLPPEALPLGVCFHNIFFVQQSL